MIFNTSLYFMFAKTFSMKFIEKNLNFEYQLLETIRYEHKTLHIFYLTAEGYPSKLCRVEVDNNCHFQIQQKTYSEFIIYDYMLSFGIDR